MKLALPFLLVAVAGTGIMLASCPNPNPNPTPPPAPGRDCTKVETLTGLVTVPEPVPVPAGKPQRYIVVLEDRSRIQPLVSVAGITEVKSFDLGYAANIANQTLQRLLEHPDVKYIQLDGVKKVSPRPAEATASWGLDRIDQRDRPGDGQYNPGADGSGVYAAVVDTGISPHDDFEDRLQTECFTAHSGGCADGHGHGTHVAGTIGGKTWGVAKKVTLVAVRVLNSSGSGSDSDVIQGIEWVTRKKRANPSQDWVINMSLGGGKSPALDQATCDAIDAGVTVVVAAGNESANADTSSPARVIQAITLGASDRFDHAASFSNFGTLLDLYAPGVSIESTQPGGGTATFSGTSMASPHAAGVAALTLQRHPGFSPAQVAESLIVHATLGKISDRGEGSPDRLAFTGEN